MRYVEKYGRVRQSTEQNIIRRICSLCCITKATNTDSEYVILTAFSQQQLLGQRASMLR
jgi:hypothetical protein